MSDTAKGKPAPLPAEPPAEGEEAPKGHKGKLAGKMKFIIIGFVALVMIGGGAGVYFSGILHVEKTHETTVMLPGPPVYYELPRITVDLKPTEKRARPFIRLVMQVELQGESAKLAFVANEVKIMDTIQAQLRTITPDELSGEQGTERLREDFLTIINRVIDPEIAITVLYKEIFIR
jgi:flagellar FliL protein